LHQKHIDMNASFPYPLRTGGIKEEKG